MKPFDIETYKKDPSMELVTRDGHPARIICTNRNADYPIVALIQLENCEAIHSYTEIGYMAYGGANPLDLFFASVKHKGWINIYKDDKGYQRGNVYKTEEDARLASVSPSVATIPIEWEE